jgi:hypothetical protein
LSSSGPVFAVARTGPLWFHPANIPRVQRDDGRNRLSNGRPCECIEPVGDVVDSIIYGTDFAHDLAHEFGFPRPAWTSADNAPVPNWEHWFDLYGTEGTDLASAHPGSPALSGFRRINQP